ncbi:MAG: SMC-Scp complex subunit ScpB [Armatimonadetes bacterium]|jgi:segregation and condensation protein B|nr:SMC-Scp complex subunit ScpB [Armatimonadota bacterium]
MEARDNILEDGCEIVSAQPVSEASVEEIAEAACGVALARESLQEAPAHRNGKLRHVVECMLFVSAEPMSADQIAQTLEVEPERVEDALSVLEEDLNCGHGLQLLRVAGGYQICTRPEFGEYCALILQPAKRKLSKAALETLAVVAYRQPCTIPEVEAVRGVDVGGVMKTLMERRLINEAGRKQAPGRPVLYTTTQEFLEYFGLNDVSELPDIDMLAVEAVKALEAQKDLFSEDAAQDDETGVDEEVGK